MLRVVRFSASIEVFTGVAVLVAPGIAGGLLLGVDLNGMAALMARLFGLALLCLGIACWPEKGIVGTPAFRALLLYNAAIAIVLIYLAGIEHYWGVLLLPAVALHAAVAVCMAINHGKPA